MRFRFPLLVLPLFWCSLGGSPVHAASVLLLGDTEAESQVSQALLAAGHTVVHGGPYFEWDGLDPNVFNHQVVVLLSGQVYEPDLQPLAVFALQAFLDSGCGLVTTEWSGWAVATGLRSDDFGDLLPIEPSIVFGEAATWTVQSPGHPLVAGVPAQFGDLGGWTVVGAPSGSIPVITDPALKNLPLLTYSSTAHSGTSVHLNHDLTYTLDAVPANILRLIANAAGFAACLPFKDGFESGTTDAWRAVR